MELIKSRPSLNLSLNSSFLSSNSSTSNNKSARGAGSGAIRTSLRKSIRTSQFSRMKDQEDESYWSGFFNNKNLLGFLDIHKYFRGHQLMDLEELRKLPGSNIWRLPAQTSLENGRTIDVAAIRNKLLAEHFGSSENVPLELLLEIFPDEQERKEFLEKYKMPLKPPQKAKKKDDIFSNVELALSEGESVKLKDQDSTMQDGVKLMQKKVVRRNENGDLEEVFVDEWIPMKKIMKKVLIENSDGELIETFVEEWIPADKESVIFSEFSSDYDAADENRRKMSSFEGSDFGDNNRQHHKKLREEKLKSSARGDDQDKEIEEEIKSIMQGMTFENEEERNKFEADLRAQFQLRRSLLYDERGNPLSPIIVANDGKKGMKQFFPIQLESSSPTQEGQKVVKGPSDMRSQAEGINSGRIELEGEGAPIDVVAGAGADYDGEAVQSSSAIKNFDSSKFKNDIEKLITHGASRNNTDGTAGEDSEITFSPKRKQSTQKEKEKRAVNESENETDPTDQAKNRALKESEQRNNLKSQQTFATNRSRSTGNIEGKGPVKANGNLAQITGRGLNSPTNTKNATKIVADKVPISKINIKSLRNTNGTEKGITSPNNINSNTPKIVPEDVPNAKIDVKTLRSMSRDELISFARSTSRTNSPDNKTTRSQIDNFLKTSSTDRMKESSTPRSPGQVKVVKTSNGQRKASNEKISSHESKKEDSSPKDQVLETQSPKSPTKLGLGHADTQKKVSLLQTGSNQQATPRSSSHEFKSPKFSASTGASSRITSQSKKESKFEGINNNSNAKSIQAMTNVTSPKAIRIEKEPSELDFLTRNMVWQIVYQKRKMEQQTLKEKEMARICTFSPRLNTNTEIIVANARANFELASERAQNYTRQRENRKSMPEIYSPSASSKSYGGTGSPTTDRFSFANRPDYRTLGKGEVEEEFYQRFPSFRATRSFANTTLDGYFQELASILATRSVEEREAIWRSIEQEFLSVNSPEKVRETLCQSPTYQSHRTASFSPSSNRTDSGLKIQLDPKNSQQMLPLKLDLISSPKNLAEKIGKSPTHDLGLKARISLTKAFTPRQAIVRKK